LALQKNASKDATIHMVNSGRNALLQKWQFSKGGINIINTFGNVPINMGINIINMIFGKFF
jgi:hypothetical protein